MNVPLIRFFPDERDIHQGAPGNAKAAKQVIRCQGGQVAAPARCEPSADRRRLSSAGQVAGRSAVPWRLVGPGWTLAVVDTAPANVLEHAQVVLDLLLES
jgi:hypothetical protein